MTIVKSVDRALSIVELISNYEEGLGITEIGEKLDLHKSTVHRLLQTLIYKDFVIQDENTKNYMISFKLYEIGQNKVENLDVLKESKDHIKKLVNKVNETVHLVVRDEDYVAYIDKVESDNTISMSSKIGRRSPMYCTSVGKVILANSTEEDIKNVWENTEIVKYTKNTIVNYEDFLKELKRVKDTGYALDDEENELGVRCIGAPIFNRFGEVEAAISASGPIMRMTKARINEIKKDVLETAENIGEKLGYKSK